MKKQHGFVSIIVASILMILLSLVAIGLSQLMQREQRQSLDRQLSSQAYYAAESAINEVIDEINTTGNVSNKSACDPDENTARNGGILDDNAPEVAFTCLLINSDLNDIVFDNSITDVESKIVKLNSAQGNFKTVTFEWSGGGSQTNIQFSCDSVLPQTIQAGSVPILRIDLVSLKDVDRLSLESETEIFFLKPADGAGCISNSSEVSANSIVRGAVIPIDCDPVDGAYACKFTISYPQGQAVDRMVARIKSLYGNADLRITGTIPNGDSVVFTGVQTEIDATGKAGDVLRRIKVRVGSGNTYQFPENGFQSYQGVCKLISAVPSITTPEVSYPCFP